MCEIGTTALVVSTLRRLPGILSVQLIWGVILFMVVMGAPCFKVMPGAHVWWNEGRRANSHLHRVSGHATSCRSLQGSWAPLGPPHGHFETVFAHVYQFQVFLCNYNSFSDEAGPPGAIVDFLFCFHLKHCSAIFNVFWRFVSDPGRMPT